MIKILTKKKDYYDFLDQNEKNILYDYIDRNEKEKIIEILSSSSETIGRPILSYQDTKKKNPLHYSIEKKNIDITLLLIEAATKEIISETDINKDSLLHYAVRTGDEEILTKIINIFEKHNISLSKANKIGNTSLHEACIQKNKEAAIILIKKGIEINTKNISDDFAALNYSILKNDFELTKILIDNGANVNDQDFYGRTPLHHAIEIGNLSIIQLLISSRYINFNMYNIYLDLPIHSFLNKYSKYSNTSEKDAILAIFINNSLMNFQNKKGESAFFLIVKMELWKKFKNNLAKKKIDILKKTITSESIIDLIDIFDINEFATLLTKSYKNILQVNKKNWNEKWENICSKSFIDDEEKKYIENLLIEKNEIEKKKSQDVCYFLIHEKMKKIIRERTGTSYPKTNKVIIDIKFINNTDFCTFMGSPLDIISGLFYLIKKKNITTPLLPVSSKENSIPIFEILWQEKNLIFHESIKKLLIEQSQKKNIQFIVIHLGIEVKENGHSNYIMYDKMKNEIERFEPYGGSTIMGLNYDQDLLDSKLKKIFVKIFPEVKYFKPKDYMGKISFQHLDAIEVDMKRYGDPGGFCAVWAIWYVDMRTKYYDISRSKLIKKLMKNIVLQNYSFKHLIRSYSNKIIKIRNDLLITGNITPNDWINESYTDHQFNTVIKNINSYIKTFIQ